METSDKVGGEVDDAALTALLKEYVGDEAGTHFDEIVEAATGGRLADVVAGFGLKNRTTAAIAAMLGRSRKGRYRDALAMTGIAVTAGCDPRLLEFVRALELALPRREGPVRDLRGHPAVYVVSYPRSGNTRFMNIMAGGVPGSRFTAFQTEGGYVSPFADTVHAPGPVFIKDHLFRPTQVHNPIIAILRDGRDCMLSYTDYLLRTAGRPVSFEEADSLAVAVGVHREGEGFGTWPGHVKRLFAAIEKGRAVTLIRYGDLVGEKAQKTVRSALRASGVAMSVERYQRGVAHAKRQEETLRTGHRSWSREPIYPAGTLMDRWLTQDGQTRWQDLLRPKDKAFLHEAGFTEALIAGGFESDPGWWRG